LHFSRLQFTPDLMPSDVIGSTMIGRNNELDYQLHFEEGPIFANLVLADEINRASPKTQSALLEAMQERSVTVRGKSHPLPRPFMVLATQNPIEMEGTYPLPEAQVDRFAFKILLKHPSHEEMLTILERTMGTESVQVESLMSAKELSVLQLAVRSIQVPPHVADMAVRLSMLTLPENSDAPDSVKRFVRYGSGPRGAQTLIIAAKARSLLDGRFHVSTEDISEIALATLRHRIALNYDGISEGLSSDTIIQDVIATIRKGADFISALQ
jgi:MoxR-like ATPase